MLSCVWLVLARAALKRSAKILKLFIDALNLFKYFFTHLVMTATKTKPKFKSLNVRLAVHGNAEKAVAVLSLSGKKVALADFAGDAINRAALPILK
jgi:hypothetical protein